MTVLSDAIAEFEQPMPSLGSTGPKNVMSCVGCPSIQATHLVVSSAGQRLLKSLRHHTGQPVSFLGPAIIVSRLPALLFLRGDVHRKKISHVVTTTGTMQTTYG